jgi:hypothetical protein
MAAPDTLVFVGPTLPAAEVAARLPGAVACPPAAMGDVLTAAHAARAARRRGIRRLAIIDGYFERMAAIWHKEILLALEGGLAVYGAASMGALRAAELDRFGMIGVGVVYRAFARGALTRDDEVAVAHLPAAFGYRAASDALVNLRDGLARAERAGVVSPRTGAALVAHAQARFYRDRSWGQLLDDGRAAGLPTRQLVALDGWRRASRPDRKAADARLLLARLARERPQGTSTRPAAARVPRTWALAQLEAFLADRADRADRADGRAPTSRRPRRR